MEVQGLRTKLDIASFSLTELDGACGIGSTIGYLTRSGLLLHLNGVLILWTPASGAPAVRPLPWKP